MILAVSFHQCHPKNSCQKKEKINVPALCASGAFWKHIEQQPSDAPSRCLAHTLGLHTMDGGRAEQVPQREVPLCWIKLLVGDEMWMREQLPGTGAGQHTQSSSPDMK